MFLQFYTERRAASRLRAFHEYPAVVILLHDALCKRKSEAPSAFLCGETRSEHVTYVLLWYTLARVAHLNGSASGLVVNGYGDAALAAHGIDSVLAEIFYHPLEERSVDVHDDASVGETAGHPDFRRRAAVHIVHHMIHDVAQVGRHKLRQRPDLGKAVGYKLQAADVVVHLGDKFVRRISLLQHFHPGHKTRYRCAELMGGLLGQAHPHLVLLGLLRREQRKDGYDNKDHDHAELHVRIGRQAAEHNGVVVANIHVVGRNIVGQRHLYHLIRMEQAQALGLDVGECVGIVGTRTDTEVAECLHVLVLVHHDDGNSSVAVEHLEHEIEISVAVGIAEGAHGLGPRLHLLVLLCREVADEKMRHEQRCDSYDDGCHNKKDLNPAYLVCPLHTDMITRFCAVYCLGG